MQFPDFENDSRLVVVGNTMCDCFKLFKRGRNGPPINVLRDAQRRSPTTLQRQCLYMPVFRSAMHMR
jgi:hypothetical protein